MRRGADVNLHVTNGDSAAGTLRLTALGGDVLAWQDALNEGPVPPLPPSELREVRGRFLAACGWGDGDVIRGELERRDELFAAALRSGRPVVLWFEHDLYDQLQLLQILALAGETGFEAARVELINVGSFPGRTTFHGLGELDADELESLWPQRKPVQSPVVERAREAWDAFRAPEPTALAGLVADGPSALPFLEAALGRLLEELPDARTGLSRGERQLLATLAGGPRTPRAAFEEAIAKEEAPFEGDSWVWRRLAALAQGDRPLVAAANGAVPPEPPPAGDPERFQATAFELTADGRAVLDGRADRVELLGIDRWLGGTHLTSADFWRWDADARRLERAP